MSTTLSTDTETDVDTLFSSIVLNEDKPDLSDSDGGDHDVFSHYVSKEDIVKSATTREAVPALCGKLWVPRRNPEGLTVCPECKEIFEAMQPGDDA